MKKILLFVSAFILAWNAHAEKQAAKAPAPVVAATVVSEDDPIDESYGGNASDQDNFGIDPAEEIDPTDEGDDQPDEEFGGFGGDDDFNVDPADEIDPSGEGDDGPDEEYGGAGEDPGFEVDPPEEIDPSGEGDDGPDEEYGGAGEDPGFEVDPPEEIDPSGEGDDGPDEEYGGAGEDPGFEVTPPDSMGVDDAEILFDTEGETVSDELYGGDEFCAFVGNKVGVEVYDNNKLIIKGWSGVKGYDLVVDFEEASFIGGISAEGNLPVGMYEVTNIIPFVDGHAVGTPDTSFGGNDSDDPGFNVDPGDIDPSGEGDDGPDTEYGGAGEDPGFEVDPPEEIDPSGEGDDGPDTEYGGAGEDPGFNVDPADEIDPSGEGDDGPDTEYGGAGEDPGFNVDPADEIDPSGEGDDGPDEEYGGAGEDPGFNVDPDFPGWVATPSGDAKYPEVHFYTEGSTVNVISETEGLIILYINCPDEEGVYDEDSLPRWYMVKYTHDTSSISSVMVIEMEQDVIYNMAGQRVGANYKGFAIKNGKKILIK